MADEFSIFLLYIDGTIVADVISIGECGIWWVKLFGVWFVERKGKMNKLMI